jgi:NAD(P)H-hydrate epimerase
VPAISIAQMREWEQASWKAGRSEAVVIRRVGLALAARARTMTRVGDRILILAGRGHNGDDARAAVNALEDRIVDVLDVREPASDFPRLKTLLEQLPDLVIDGLFGVGLNRPLDGSWIEFLGHLNATRRRVLAVDVPSGLNADTGQPQGAAVEAGVTLTVGAPKTGLLMHSATPFVGRLEVAADVGLTGCPFESELQWTLADDFKLFPPARAATGHKGSYGHLAILAGSLGYHGAAVLAARAAQRARPGLITLFVHEPAYVPAASQLQAVMVRPWQTAPDLTEPFCAVLMGPGLAADQLAEPLRPRVRELWAKSPLAVVVDASALDWLEGGAIPDAVVRVITPHPGEAARMLGLSVPEVQADRPRALRALSRKYGGCWVVLKGHQTLIGRSEGAICVNPSGNPDLAQGGAGDVLGGYLAGLLAQPALRLDPGRTLAFAVWQHGAAADRLADARPNWILEELVEVLGPSPTLHSSA